MTRDHTIARRIGRGVSMTDCPAYLCGAMLPPLSERERFVLANIGEHDELAGEFTTIIAQRARGVRDAKLLLHARYLARVGQRHKVYRNE